MPRSERPDDGSPERGLAAERTSLAWGRTALSLSVIGALFVRAGATSATEAIAYPLGGLVMLAAVVVWLWLPTVRTQAVARGDMAAQRAMLRRMSAGATALGVAAGALVVVSAFGP